jgi:acyl-CoA reductase-like NAD-dependent aldehyde dehydrogenase
MSCRFDCENGRQYRKKFADKIVKAAKAKKVGNGLDEGVEWTVITAGSKQRIESLIDIGLTDGCKLLWMEEASKCRAMNR